MWYLIKDLTDNQCTVRYCESTDRVPIAMLCRDDSYSYWVVDITLLTSRINRRHIDSTNFLSIDEMTTDSSYTIIPLPGISPDITSITSILEVHPELLI